MDFFGNWSDVGNFPGVREFTNGHAFVEEVIHTTVYIHTKTTFKATNWLKTISRILKRLT